MTLNAQRNSKNQVESRCRKHSRIFLLLRLIFSWNKTVHCASSFLIAIMSKTKMARGSDFSRDKVLFLDSITEIILIGMDECAAIERQNEVSFPGQNRMKESLCGNLQSLYLIKKSTRDPTHAHQKFEGQTNSNRLSMKSWDLKHRGKFFMEDPIDKEKHRSDKQQRTGAGGQNADNITSSLSERNMPTTMHAYKKDKERWWWQ